MAISKKLETIYHNGQLHSESTGELQFTEYGISGPVILYGIFSSWVLGVIYWLGTILR